MALNQSFLAVVVPARRLNAISQALLSQKPSLQRPITINNHHPKGGLLYKMIAVNFHKKLSKFIKNYVIST